MLVDRAARLREVRLGQRRVVGTAAGEHHVVDGRRQVLEEPLQAIDVGRVEGGGALRAELAGGVLEALGVAGREDDLGALGPRQAGRLEADAGAAADDDDGLPEQLGLALDGSGGGCGAHAVSSAAAVSMRSALSAST